MAEYRRKNREQAQLHAQQQQLQHSTQQQEARERSPGQPVPCIIEVDENFTDSIGDTLGPFILKNEKHFAAVLDKIERETHVDTRPLWKILKEQEKCDVLSILEKEETLLSPRELARRRRAFKVFNQIYFNKSWIDVLFLKNLRENKNLLLPQSKVSTPFLRYLTHTKYDVVTKFLKMLQARSPLYTEQLRKCPDKRVWVKHRESYLNHVQYQTRRTMLSQMRSIHRLRKEDNIEDNIVRSVHELELQTVKKLLENWNDKLSYCEDSRGSHMKELVFHT